VTLSDEIREFVSDHQPLGQLIGDATEPGVSGYEVWITCPCGVEFRR
jgi:hypothetical protein